MNKKVKVIAAAAACAAALCMAGVSGCAAASRGLVVDSFWYISNFDSFQPSATDPEQNGRQNEVLLYEITADAEAAGNAVYSVNYFTDGEDFASGENAHYFRTTFYATGFDWSDERVNEKYRLTADDAAALPDSSELKARLDGTVETVYVLKTELAISGEYVYGDDESTAVRFSDSMVTETYFRSSGDGLQPVYSTQDAVTTVPKSISPSSADEMCEQLDYEYEVSYSPYGTEAEITYSPADGEAEVKTVSLDSDPGAVFDNNTLYTVIRGLSLSENFGAALNLLIPADGGVSTVNVSAGSRGELDATDDADMISALTAAYGEPPSEDAVETTEADAGSNIFYYPVSIGASSGRGVTRTAWYAAVEDERNNTYRATMLRLYQPLSYSLGAWEFRLAEVEGVLGRQV